MRNVVIFHCLFAEYYVNRYFSRLDVIVPILVVDHELAGTAVHRHTCANQDNCSFTVNVRNYLGQEKGHMCYRNKNKKLVGTTMNRLHGNNGIR